MKSPDEYDEMVQRIERQIREKETQHVVPEQKKEENKIQEVKFYNTTKHEAENSGKLWQKKAVLGLKLFGVAVVGIVAVRVASFVAGVVIIGALVFVSYKLFFDNNK
jgi:Flp pilus assembly protein TadB